MATLQVREVDFNDDPVFPLQRGDIVPVVSTDIFHVDATFVRPNDTTQYTAGDVIGSITGAPSLLTFTLPANLKSGYIVGANLIDSNNAATVLQSEFWIFDHSTGNFPADNAAFVAEDVSMRRWLDTIPFVNYFVGGATDGSGQSTCYSAKNLNIPFTVGPAGALCGVPVARNAYAPAAQEVFTYRLWIQRP